MYSPSCAGYTALVIWSTEVILPSVKLNTPGEPNTKAVKFNTVSL